MKIYLICFIVVLVIFIIGHLLEYFMKPMDITRYDYFFIIILIKMVHNDFKEKK